MSKEAPKRDATARFDGVKPRAFGKAAVAPASPSPTAPTPNRKRSASIAIGAIGVSALGIFAISNWDSCRSGDPNNPNASQQCRSGRSSGSGSSSWSSNSEKSSQQVATKTVNRGGFGKTGMSFFGGGG